MNSLRFLPGLVVAVASGLLLNSPSAHAVSVVLTSPVNGAAALAPASLTLTATVVNGPGTVTNVLFYSGATLLGADATAPYSLAVMLGGGNTLLRAIAIDDTGTATVSDAVAVTVRHVVNYQSFSFSPSGLTVPMGDSVLFTNKGGVHFVLGTGPEKFCGQTQPSPSCLHDFTNAPGNYPYRCGIHSTMVGSVTVQAVANKAPVVRLLVPAAGAVFSNPANGVLSALAFDADGSIASVRFRANGNTIWTVSSPPYQLPFISLPAGNVTLTAVAEDNLGLMTTSDPINVTVTTPNQPPVVSLTSPTNGALFPPPASFPLEAQAADADGTVTNVQFFSGLTLLGADDTSPFSLNLPNLGTAIYQFRAVATDNQGARGTSAVVAVTVDALPTVSLVSPADGTVLAAPATLTAVANVSDADNAVVEVRLYSLFPNLLGEMSGAPPSLILTDLPVGEYTFVAEAIDEFGGISYSTPVRVSVVTPGPLQLSVLGSITNGLLPLALTTTPGLRYTVEGATDLGAWLSLTNFAASGTNSFFAAPAPPPRRFFRALLEPNP